MVTLTPCVKVEILWRLLCLTKGQNNVLLDGDYIARLGDFGYASLVGNIPEALTYLQRSTARPGALRWIAPEQVDPKETFNRTTKSDIYSFGCVALQGSSLESDTWPMLISFQVLSGKQPWSEVQEDLAVVLCMAKGHQPGRPKSRTLNDSHWNLIQHCWSPIEERPAADAIILTIQQFLSHCPQCPPLCDLLPSWSGQADLWAESSSSSLGKAPSEGLSTHHGVSQAASDEDDQNDRYIVMNISVQLIILTPRHIHLSGSLRFLMHRAWTGPTRASNAAHR